MASVVLDKDVVSGMDVVESVGVETINKMKGEVAMADKFNKDDRKIVQKEPATGEGAAKIQKNSRVKADDADARYKEKTLALADIVRDEDLFGCRVKRNKATVEKYLILYRDNREAEANGEEPIHKIKLILVWWDEARRRFVLLGGDHRLTAALLAGYTEMAVIVLYGSENEAFTAATRDNATHGLGLNDRDKTYLVRKSLQRFGDTKKHREIASDVGCSPALVTKVYKELFGKGKRQSRTGNATGKPEQVQQATATPATTVPNDADSDNVPFTFDEHKEPEKSDQERIQEAAAYLNALEQTMVSPKCLYNWARRWGNLRVKNSNKDAQSNPQA